MAQTLQRIAYMSRRTPASMTLLGVAEILGEAQRNNDRAEITGALAVGDQEFLQILEGPADALDGLMARLGRDGRHDSLLVLQRMPIPTRQFTGWSMKGPLNSATIRRMVTDVRDGRLSPDAAANAMAAA